MISVVSKPKERESAERAVSSAVRRGTWRPAFAGGVPVVDGDYVFTEKVYVRIGEQGSQDGD